MGVLATAIALVGMSTTSATAANKVRATSTATTATAPSAGGTSASPGFGVTLPGVPVDLTPLQTFTQLVGRAPSTVMWYQQWAGAGGFPSDAADRVAATGAVPEITWEPWNAADGTTQPAYSLSAIAFGQQDAYIRSWATSIARWGKPLRLRFAHEMNGSWYPWAEGVNGNATGSYSAAWRHVHDLFVASGARNVIWVWSPNVSYPGSMGLTGLFPGDSYVDEVALDGYNWSTLQAGTTWQSFAQIFQPSLDELHAITARPASIGEVASTEVGGDKAQWITDMFTTLKATPAIRGFTWFDFAKETDWRVDSSAASAAAFRAGLAAVYAG